MKNLGKPDENIPQIIFEVIQDIIKDRKIILNRKSDNKQSFNRKVFAKIYFCNKGIELVQFARILRRFKNKIPENFKYKDPQL